MKISRTGRAADDKTETKGLEVNRKPLKSSKRPVRASLLRATITLLIFENMVAAVIDAYSKH